MKDENWYFFFFFMIVIILKYVYLFTRIYESIKIIYLCYELHKEELSKIIIGYQITFLKILKVYDIFYYH